MAILFVHGVPATARVWDRLIAALDRPADEVRAIDLPGFAGPPPEGWVPDKDRYVAFVIEAIEALYRRSGPVHLVGHDWGCLLALRAASLRPELLRSVAAGNAPIDPQWPLHAAWEAWRQPVIGEAAMEALQGPAFLDALAEAGYPEDHLATNAFSHADGRRCILGLYRSAIDIGVNWSADLARIVVPSMLIWGERDLIVPIEIGRRMAARMGAELVALDADHFWPAQRPAEAAAALTRLWARVERTPYTIFTQPSYLPADGEAGEGR